VEIAIHMITDLVGVHVENVVLVKIIQEQIMLVDLLVKKLIIKNKKFLKIVQVINKSQNNIIFFIKKLKNKYK
jgi:hypothetical protein